MKNQWTNTMKLITAHSERCGTMMIPIWYVLWFIRNFHSIWLDEFPMDLMLCSSLRRIPELGIERWTFEATQTKRILKRALSNEELVDFYVELQLVTPSSSPVTRYTFRILSSVFFTVLRTALAGQYRWFIIAEKTEPLTTSHIIIYSIRKNELVYILLCSIYITGCTHRHPPYT